MHYQTAEESRAANITYHLVPTTEWSVRGVGQHYVPEAFDADGFIHCTNGLEPLIEVANMFYMVDERDYEALILDVTRINAEVRYDDPDEKFPHIYGPLNTDAVIGRMAATRASDGIFLEFSSRA